MGGSWGCRLYPLEVCYVIYLIPQGERTYGMVIWEGMPVISFLVYAEKSLNLKRDFNSHWVLNSASVMFT